MRLEGREIFLSTIASRVGALAGESAKGVQLGCFFSIDDVSNCFFSVSIEDVRVSLNDLSSSFAVAFRCISSSNVGLFSVDDVIPDCRVVSALTSLRKRPCNLHAQYCVLLR